MANLHTIPEALTDLRAGKAVIVVDDEDRENEGDIVVAAEMITPELINFMAVEARGLICTPMELAIAEKLDFPPMIVENSLHGERCNFAVSVDLKSGIGSGISAADRAATIKHIVDPVAVAADFMRPGHVFPLRARAGGVLVRAGHTEAAVDMAKLAGFCGAGVICEVIKSDGTMARLPDLLEFGKKHDLKTIAIADLIAYRRQTEKLVKRVSEAKLPTMYGDFRVIVYENTVTPRQEFIALVHGEVETAKNVLVRVHSECLTGDTFGSLRCDCREQKDEALRQIGGSQAGVFLYLRQEGRGIGLVNKIKAYALQDAGADTVEANEKLGFQADIREYGLGAQVLYDLGLRHITLLTNNPKKIKGLAGYGLEITRQAPLEITAHKHNADYLRVKKDKLGHLLSGI